MILEEAERTIMLARVYSNITKHLKHGQTRTCAALHSIESALAQTRTRNTSAANNISNTANTSNTSNTSIIGSDTDLDTKKRAIINVRLFSAWFCPFAQRAQLAIERHRDVISYESVESLGWERRTKTDEDGQTTHENWYHYKSAELLKVNELGMVPTIVDVDTGCVITESINCIQYIDEVVRERSNDSSSSSSSSSSSEKKKMDYILAETANERQKERVYADIMAKTVCSKYYTVLVRQDEREQLEAFDEILKGIEKFAANLVHDVEGKTGKGPFFNGRDTPGLVDYTLFPWAWRLPVFEHYRDSRFKIDQSKSVGLFKYTVWLAEMCKRDDVKRTLPNWDEYLEHIGRYADGSARSKVANAVRDGRNAHDYDDEKDKM